MRTEKAARRAEKAGERKGLPRHVDMQGRGRSQKKQGERKPEDAKGAKTRARERGSKGPRRQGERQPKDATGAKTREREGSEHPKTQWGRKPENATGASTGRCKEDETKRPKPKEKITEEEVHPHPGPPAMEDSTDLNVHQKAKDKRKC